MILKIAKEQVGRVASAIAETFCELSLLFLAKAPISSLSAEGVKKCFQALSSEDQKKVEAKVEELVQKDPMGVQRDRWYLTQALHRLGFLEAEGLLPVFCLPFQFGEGGLGSRYFSLSDRKGKDPQIGRLGYVNGMGVPTLDAMQQDVMDISDRLVQGCDLHCVYHATHQISRSGDVQGFLVDILRMKAVDGGSYTKTAYLLAQEWLDFFYDHPTSYYLQLAHSEGAVHVNAALRLLQDVRPEVLARLRILTLCPAHFILPETYGRGLQVINLVKREDRVIAPWGVGTHHIGVSEHVYIVPHTISGEDPHFHLSEDYARIARPYIVQFLHSGDLYP